MSRADDDRYDVLLATVASAVVRLDVELRILDFNRQAERAFGLKCDDVIGRSFTELAHLARHGDALVRELREAARGRSLTWTECDFEAADGGEHILMWTAQPLHQGTRVTGLIVVGQDLTELRRAERRAELLEREADRRRRLAEVGAIVARIAHDLSNPLTAATLLLSVLEDAAQRKPETPAGELRGALAELGASLADLRELVDGCRQFMRDQQLELGELAPAELLRDVLRTWTLEAAQRGVQLRAHIAPHLPPVVADAAKLRRALDNLVRNALEAIERGPGSVCIAIEPEPDGISISVEDTGPGLPEGVDVFAPFATTKAHGTGLGLAIARQFVEAHGGRIVAERTAPHGTRFRLTVPSRPPVARMQLKRQA